MVDGSKSSIISIHALLAESDAAGRFCYLDNIISIHALLAESDDGYRKRLMIAKMGISIHALLAESDSKQRMQAQALNISIHALLAESDLLQKPIAQTGLTFLSTLSLRRATFVLALIVVIGYNFYPRSPCGERRQITRRACVPHIISIHALLAESDPMRRCKGNPQWYFYPRSPCGERR